MPSGSLGVSYVEVTLPVVNVRPEATMTVVLDQLVLYPVLMSNDWQCGAAFTGVSETTVTCRWTGAETAAGALVLGLLVPTPMQVDAAITQAPGTTDPAPGNNTASILLEPTPVTGP